MNVPQWSCLAAQGRPRRQEVNYTALGWRLSLAATSLCQEMPREEVQGKDRKKHQPLGHVLLWKRSKEPCAVVALLSSVGIVPAHRGRWALS